MQLIERERGRLVAVPEAQYLRQECVELLNRMGMVSQNMRRLRALQSGELNIACKPGPSGFYVRASASRQKIFMTDRWQRCTRNVSFISVWLRLFGNMGAE